jgi:putative transcriptional regulator
MKKGVITKFRLDPKNPPKADWSRFDAMTEAERLAAAKADPDCRPVSKARLKRARRVPDVAAIRREIGLTQEEFATRFRIPLGTLRDWEQGTHRPDRAAQVLLIVISRNPKAVAKALEEEPV